MANVRFYKLSSLPTFVASTHTGIFVHLTTDYTDTNNEITYPEGLWFGGRNGWEYLTNSTTAIDQLDAETIETLVAEDIPADRGSGTILTLKGVKEDDGIIEQGDGTSKVTIGAGKLQIGVGNADDPSDLFGANDTTNTVLVLDSTHFHYNPSAKKLNIITESPTTDTNKIATMADIASLTGAMHYKGVLNSPLDFPLTTEPGDVYIVTTAFTYDDSDSDSDSDSGITFEVGDMVVYGNNGSMNIVQSNMTIGVNDGQFAVNDGALTSGNIVVATGTGIETSDYSLSGASSRTQTITDATTDGQTPIDGVNHSTSIVDTLTIFGEDRTTRLVIGSTNPSIEVKEGLAPDVEVSLDLVWNTTIPSVQNESGD